MPSVGNPILASDYNTLSDNLKALYGVGTGTSGYGQIAYSLGHVTGGSSPITSTEWQTASAVITVLGTHQNTSTASNPVSDWVLGHTVDAADVTALNALATTLTTNRFNVAGGEATLALNQFSSVRGTDWGNGAVSIGCTFNVTWADENHARYFFNAGGQLRIRLAQPSTATAQDSDWNTVLATKVGTVTFNHNATSNSGSIGGGGGAIGFYQLNDAPQYIYNGTSIGGGAYAANDVFIQAQRLNFVGTNGGNGNGVQFVVTLADLHTNGVSYDDVVHAGTAMAVDHQYSAVAVVTTAPSYAAVANF